MPPMGGGCSLQVEWVVLKLHKGPGAPVPGCKVGELSKTLEYDSNNDEDNNQICMSVKVLVCLCYGFQLKTKGQRPVKEKGMELGTKIKR